MFNIYHDIRTFYDLAITPTTTILLIDYRQLTKPEAESIAWTKKCIIEDISFKSSPRPVGSL
ncbi:MAG: hypothetical protein CMP10_18760 [Zetaproteobacteria bacterium]|nr:hypothetical protein [Pseudobdellovibrionaceae bacterium]